ncbi:MAG TPA: polysaccharide pyruvyl transferase family protein [Verrucomicrobiae bacterium]|nr:polysaccharide pyruvyl transferase family protein [Verrucomicrobiae bacterium]
MRIILDNGAYTLRNMGDVAMLQASVRRLRELADRPELMVLTTNPQLLNRYCPGTIPLSVKSRDAGYAPLRPAGSPWAEWWARFKLRWKRVPKEAVEFQNALAPAHAVFLCGGGFLNDLNPYQTRPVLRMLTDAAARGKRVAMFSQGLGPLESPELLSLLGMACRAGVKVALREPLHGVEILERAGANAARYSITGDDAIEAAVEHRNVVDQTALGFSIRQVAYSEVESKHLEIAGSALDELATRLSAQVVPLPVSFNSHESDHAVISKLTGAEVPELGADEPEALIRATGRCRLVVTGTYHAAVFALAQGIPCVSFYVSTYYRNKMDGLSRQFPGGCKLVDLNLPDARVRLIQSALEFWETTRNSLSQELRAAASEQVLVARGFYKAALGQAGG